MIEQQAQVQGGDGMIGSSSGARVGVLPFLFLLLIFLLLFLTGACSKGFGAYVTIV